MKVLELFSGTGSVAKICDELGWEVYSVDLTDRFYHVDKKIDILEWDYKELDFKPDIIWASPPCASFSHMLHISKRKDEIEKLMVEIGLPLLNKTREIIDYFKPKYYFIENPDTGRMKRFITDLPFYKVCYCMYGYTYRKSTRIWTNVEGFDAKYCNHKGKHDAAIGHGRMTDSKCGRYKGKTGDVKKKNDIVNSLEQKYSIPPQLIRDLFTTILTN